MTNKSPKPSPANELRLLGNLRRARLAMEEVGPQELLDRLQREVKNK